MSVNKKENQHRWYLKNKIHCSKYGKLYKMKNKEKIKQYHLNNRLKKKYGISPRIYEEMFLKQGGLCAICNRKQIPPEVRLCIDHDHTTGKIRKLLCNNCNFGLGHFQDDIIRMERAIQYIKDHK